MLPIAKCLSLRSDDTLISMRLLFVHDNRFWPFGDKLYSYGHFAYDLLWRRYLAVFDEIRVGGRFQPPVTAEEQIQGLSRSDGPKVSFFPLPDLMTVGGLRQLRLANSKLEAEMRRVDFLIVRLPSNLGYLACHLARKLGMRYLVENVGCTWDDLWNFGRLAGRLAALPSFVLQRYYVRKAPYVLYVSRHFLQNRYPNSQRTLACPDTTIHEMPVCLLERRLLHIKEMNSRGEIRVGLIASLNVGYKGHDTAIRALARLVPKYPRLKLCFLGGGDRQRWLQLAQALNVESHLAFDGSLPGGQPVLDWLDHLDVFIMPSLQETLGRALLEAMSRGCPAIGGAGTAVPEQLPDDCIHQRKDHLDLARLLDGMLSSTQYMSLCAIENFYRARKYCEELLTGRREDFWCEAAGITSPRRFDA